MAKSKVVIPIALLSLLAACGLIWYISNANFGALSQLGALSKYRCYTNSAPASQPHVPREGTATLVPFTISGGQSLEEIAQRLQDADVVTDASYLVCYLKKTNLDSTIQAGYFELSSKNTVIQLAEALQKASIPAVTVTIPEGLMISEIAAILDNKFTDATKQFDKAEFISLTKDKEFFKTVPFVLNRQTTLEGYLYPDTYSIHRNATSKEVLQLMLSTFEKKVLDVYRKEINNSKYSLQQIMILASMIEREERDPAQKKYVSDIIQRRLKENWNLGIDATLLYYFKDWKHVLTAQDLVLNTPYNTRNRTGLPPTPICNPGIESVRAVLFPEPNPYWYYLHGNDGKIHYARTNAEHEENKRKYLQ